MKRIEAVARTDKLGEPEVFTWDLFPVVDPNQTTHLGANGLPFPGTFIVPGMVLIGRIRKSSLYDPARQPTALEIQGMPFNELKERYGNMWEDVSLYADSQTSGIVKEAYIEVQQGRQHAVVILE